MEMDIQIANNYLPFNVHTSVLKMCYDDKENDLEFEIQSFELSAESEVAINEIYIFSLQVKLNQLA